MPITDSLFPESLNLTGTQACLVSFSYEEDGNMTPRITIGLKDSEDEDGEDEE